jgi:hypothetical protein
MVEVESSTGRLLRHAAGGSATDVPPLAEVDWEQFVALAIEHRLAPLALNLGTVLPPVVVTRLKAPALKSAQVNLRLTAEMMRILGVLKQAGIRAVPFKGAVTAQLYGHVSLRPFGDIDVLITARDISKAQKALSAIGFTPETDIPATMGEDLLRWGCEYNMVAPDKSFIVELHWQIAPRAYAMHWVFTEDSPTRSISINGESITTLSTEEDMLVLCMHAAKHVWNTLLWISDIGRAMQQPLDWCLLKNRAEIFGVARICAVSFALANQLLRFKLPADVHHLFPCNKAVQALADDLSVKIFAARNEYFTLQDHWLFLRARERKQDKIAYLWRMATGIDTYGHKTGVAGRVARVTKVLSGSAVSRG